MRIASALLMVLALLAGAAAPGLAATSQTENVRTELNFDVTSVAPGAHFNAVLDMHIRKNWHTYWINPGDAGEPTRVSWTWPLRKLALIMNTMGNMPKMVVTVVSITGRRRWAAVRTTASSGA